MRQRVAQRPRDEASQGICQRVAPPHIHEVGVRVAREADVQALSSCHVFVEHRCLTPAFSGAAYGTPMLMRTARRGLRCMRLLDGLSMHSLDLNRSKLKLAKQLRTSASL